MWMDFGVQKYLENMENAGNWEHVNLESVEKTAGEAQSSKISPQNSS